MASKAEQFDFTAKTSYDWTSWFDGGTWVLEQGVDFKVKISTMRSIAFGRAIARELQLKTAVRGNKLYIQATKK